MSKAPRRGDVLAVDILGRYAAAELGLQSHRAAARHAAGRFSDYTLKILPIDRAAGTVQLPWGGKLALRPFFGIMSVAPPPNWGRITSIVPRAMGGNMDNKELRRRHHGVLSGIQ